MCYERANLSFFFNTVTWKWIIFSFWWGFVEYEYMPLSKGPQVTKPGFEKIAYIHKNINHWDFLSKKSRCEIRIWVLLREHESSLQTFVNVKLCGLDLWFTSRYRICTHLVKVSRFEAYVYLFCKAQQKRFSLSRQLSLQWTGSVSNVASSYMMLCLSSKNIQCCLMFYDIHLFPGQGFTWDLFLFHDTSTFLFT